MSEKKSIIELLGIKPIDPYIANDLIESRKSEYVCLEDEVREVEKQRNETLEALIDFMVVGELVCETVGNGFNNTYHDQISIIEAACHPLEWTEIKEIINAN